MKEESVLVVDDSPTILKLVQMVLTKAGFRVTTAETGEAGIQAAAESVPDLLLLDYLLPDLNGDDVCRALSGNVSLAEVPIVVMSAKGDEIDSAFARAGNNIVDILPKPFSPDGLLAVVNHALQRKAGSKTGSETGDAHPEAPSGDYDVRGLLPGNPDPGEQPSAPSGGPALADGAALVGDLAVISIADVLLLLQERQHSGLLRLTRETAQLEITLANGRINLAAATGVPEEFLLGRFLVRTGGIEQAALDAVIEERHRSGATELLGADLCQRGLLSAAALRKAVVRQTTALVYEGLRWGDGLFSFHPGVDAPPAANQAALGLPIDGLIMQGLRRIEEWRLIEQEVGDFDTVFVRNDDKLSTFPADRLLREEIAVLDLVNGKNTVRDIVRLSKMGSYDVTHVLFRLLRCKLVRRRVAPVVG